MRKSIKWFISIIVIAIVVVIIAAIVFISSFNINNYKTAISSQFTKVTGRTLTINGNIQLSLFPWLGLKLHDASIGNPAGFANKQFASIGEVDIKVKLLPLFSGRLEANKIIAKRAQINLIKNAKGESNWQHWNKNGKQKLAAITNPSGSPLGYNAAIKASTQMQKTPWKINISAIELDNSTLTYRDQQTDQNIKLDHIQFSSHDINIGNSFPLLASLHIVSNKPKLTGQVNLKANLLVSKGLAQINLEKMRLQSTLQGEGLPNKQMNVVLNTTINLNQTAQAVRLVNLDLQAAPLMLKKVNGQFRYGEQTSSMNNDLSVKGQLNLSELGFGPFKMQHVIIGILAKNNVYSIPSLSADVYGGRLTASGRYDHSGETPIINIKQSLKNMQAGPLMATLGLQVSLINYGVYASSMFNKLWQLFTTHVQGNANFNTELTTQGKNAQALRSNLHGKLAFAFKDGAIKGINIGYLINLGTALINRQTPPQRTTSPTQTTFGLLQGSFSVRNGIASSNDLLLESPLLRVTGKGSANLSNNTLNFMLKATQLRQKTVGGQQVNVPSKLVIPLLVKGTLQQPTIRPDMQTILLLQGKQQIDKEIDKNIGGSFGKTLKKKLNQLENLLE